MSKHETDGLFYCPQKYLPAHEEFGQNPRGTKTQALMAREAAFLESLTNKSEEIFYDKLTPYYRTQVGILLSNKQKKILETFGRNPIPQTVTSIARQCWQTSQTCSGLLHKMKELGFVSSSDRKTDRRFSEYRVTDPQLLAFLVYKFNYELPLEQDDPRFITNFIRNKEIEYANGELEIAAHQK